jgi:hypothetical protein
VSELRSEDINGVFGLTTTTVTMSDPLDTNTILAKLNEMMTTVPLETDRLGDQYQITFNNDCCEPAIVEASNGVTTDDEYCACSNPEGWQHDRRQTHVPAGFDYTIPGDGAPGATGELYAADDPFWIAGYTFRWLPAGGGTYVYDDSDLLFVFTATAWAKKSLLTRTTPDDWVVKALLDDAGEYIDPLTCMATDVGECRRYFYPTGADAGGGGASSSVEFVLDGRGEIRRMIPLKTVEMEPFPCPDDPACPTGGDDDMAGGLDNPCVP